MSNPPVLPGDRLRELAKVMRERVMRDGPLGEKNEIEEWAETVEEIVRSAAVPLGEQSYLTPAQAVVVLVRDEMKHAENYVKPDSGVLRFLITPAHLNILLQAIEAAAVPLPPDIRSQNMTEQDVLNDPSVVWYGPHACEYCGATIVRSALEKGGEKFNPPERLLRVYQRGSESHDVELVYPQAWTPHVCDDTAKANKPTATGNAEPPDTAPAS